jgi:hypothetical protein
MRDFLKRYTERIVQYERHSLWRRRNESKHNLVTTVVSQAGYCEPYPCRRGRV